jgi:hypothetical protein
MLYRNSHQNRFILPILAEYADAGYREPKGRILFALRANAQYQALVFGSGIVGLIYVFVTYGVKPDSLKGMFNSASSLVHSLGS